jgi:serralysin
VASLPATHPITGTYGDDVIGGSRHSDVISGKSGDDTLRGQTGHDAVWGGQGHDLLYGNSGNDYLYGSGGPNMIQVSTIPITDDYPVRVIFEGETAGYRNSFGYYKINPDTREIYDVDIIWENASLRGSGGELIAGESDQVLDVQAGDSIGFFIISNGYSYNDFASLGEGGYAFVDADGSPATLDSRDPSLVFQSADGSRSTISYHQYHTAAFDETVGLNPDGLLHTTGVLKTDKGEITLGFEDLYNGGDRDFDDSVFTVDLGPANASFLNAHYRQEQGLDVDTGNGDDGGTARVVVDDDKLWGGTGNDELWGHKGDDILYGGTGNDELHGGSGEDVLYGESGKDEMYGNLGNDWLYGGTGDDRMIGGSGDDLLDGGNNDDRIDGNSGNDTLIGGHGDDVLNGNSGDDSLRGDNGNDVLNGHSGNDILLGNAGRDTLSGSSGDDRLEGGSGDDMLSGGSGADLLYGGTGSDILNGNSGDDILNGGGGGDTLNGGSGIDTADYSNWLKGISADLRSGVVKGDGVDSLISIENLNATDFNDKVIGSNKDNVINGAGGNDKLYGYSGDDIVNGGTGDDYLNGASGSDILAGETGADTLRGGKGADWLYGGEGDDLLWGGELGRNDGASDLFVFDKGAGSDTIMDFEVGTDQVGLSELLDTANWLNAATESDEGTYLDFSAMGGEAGSGVMIVGVSMASLEDQDWIGMV